MILATLFCSSEFICHDAMMSTVPTRFVFANLLVNYIIPQSK